MTSTTFLQKAAGLRGHLGPEDTTNKKIVMNNIHEVLDTELDKIPLPEKESLVRAKQDAPQLLAEESYQTVFLHFHNFQATKAAEHLAKFWSLRAKLFSDREFMHMNQLGTGTLTQVDIQTLETGFLMVLPFDLSGNYVLAYDPSKAAGSTLVSQRRCFFYMLCHVVKEQSLQGLAKQINFLILMNKNEAERVRDKRFFADILKVFPIKLAEVHVILEATALTDSGYKEMALAKINAKFDLPPDYCVIHSILPSLSMCDELSIYGFRNENIPFSIGGSWTEQSFKQWRDQVLVHEGLKSHSLIPQTDGQTTEGSNSWQQQKPMTSQNNDINANKRTRMDDANVRNNVTAAMFAVQQQQQQQKLNLLKTSNPASFAAQLASMQMSMNQNGGLMLPVNLSNNLNNQGNNNNNLFLNNVNNGRNQQQQGSLDQTAFQTGPPPPVARHVNNIDVGISRMSNKKQKTNSAAGLAFPDQRTIQEATAGSQPGTNMSEKKNLKKKMKNKEDRN